MVAAPLTQQSLLLRAGAVYLWMRPLEAIQFGGAAPKQFLRRRDCLVLSGGLRHRAEQKRLCVETLNKYAPGIKEQVMWAFVSTPLDVENKFPNMVRGSIKQGAYHPLQMGYNRPNDECSNHRTPIRNLYLCGASTHPGGLITFGPGYVATNRIAEDLGIKKWWSEPGIVSKARERGLI